MTPKIEEIMDLVDRRNVHVENPLIEHFIKIIMITWIIIVINKLVQTLNKCHKNSLLINIFGLPKWTFPGLTLFNPKSGQPL